jgi:hypothetical protein
MDFTFTAESDGPFGSMVTDAINTFTDCLKNVPGDALGYDVDNFYVAFIVWDAPSDIRPVRKIKLERNVKWKDFATKQITDLGTCISIDVEILNQDLSAHDKQSSKTVFASRLIEELGKLSLLSRRLKHIDVERLRCEVRLRLLCANRPRDVNGPTSLVRP